MNFCSRCGTKLTDGNLFCIACGARIADMEEQAEIDLKRQEVEAEAEKKRWEEELKKRKEEYAAFRAYTTADCDVFAMENYICEYDEMEFTAVIHPYYQYLDSFYARDKYGNYEKPYQLSTWDHDRAVNNTNISMRIEMACRDNNCLLFPGLSFSAQYDSKRDRCEYIIIKYGENRYRIKPAEMKIIPPVKNRAYEIAEISVPFGNKDLTILKEIVSGRFPVKIKIGGIQAGPAAGTYTCSSRDLEDLKYFLEVCEKAGITEQEAMKEEPLHLVPFTLFNPEAEDAGISEAGDAGTGEAEDAGTGEEQDTGTDEAEDTGTDEAEDTGLGEDQDTGTGEAEDAGTGEDADEGESRQEE